MMLPPPPIRALICDPDKETRHRLSVALKGNPLVESIIEVESLKRAIDCLGEEAINTIFVDPLALELDASSSFIFRVRESIPHIVFCLYVESLEKEKRAVQFFDGERNRFKHYYTLDKLLEGEAFRKEADAILAFCVSDVRIFSELERMSQQRSFYLEALPPHELRESIKKFRRHHPTDKKIAFIMMKFEQDKLHKKIQQHIQEALLQFSIIGVRADEIEFNSNLLLNVQTYLHCCDFGIAVFDRIQDDHFNPNVAYEVGYMAALRKPICHLKDTNLKSLHTDLIGNLYVEFETQELKKSIKRALRQWIGRQAFGNGERGE